MRFCLSSLILLLTTVVNAQNDSLTYDIENIVISQNRIQLPFSDQSRTINIINKQTIKSLNANSLAEVLQTVVGVDVRQRGINGVQSDVSIRGGTFEQVLVLIDGIKSIDPQTGHHLMNIPVNIHDIERIEILKGPSARLYGINAFAGAINIVTQKSQKETINLKAEYGSYNMLNGFATLSMPVGKFDQKLSLGHESSDGYRENTDYKISNANYSARVGSEKNQINIFAGYTDRKFGANGFYGRETFSEQYEEVRTLFASVSSEHTIDQLKITPKFSYRRNKDNWQFRRTDPDFFQNFHTTNVFTSEVHSSYVHSAGILGAGIEHNRIGIESSNLSDHNRDQLSFYVENRFLFLNEKLDVTPGFLLLKISDFDTKLFPGIDIGYAFNKNFKTYFNVGTTTRIPTYTDLYYEDSGNVGNPNLTEEVAFTAELGFKYSEVSHSFATAFFYRNTENQIDWFRENEADKWMPDNFSNANYLGFELFANTKWGRGLPVNGVLDISYSFIDAQFEENDFAFSRNALENLKHQFVLAPQLNVKNFNFLFLAKYNDRVSLEDYFLLDFSVNYKAKKFTIFGKVNNILGEEYRETNLVPMPGRWIKFGVTARV